MGEVFTRRRHIDIAEARAAEGKLHPYVAIDRPAKFARVQVVGKTGPTSASAFPMALIAVVPHGTHTAPTDNAIPFHADTPTDGERHEPHGRKYRQSNRKDSAQTRSIK